MKRPIIGALCAFALLACKKEEPAAPPAAPTAPPPPAVTSGVDLTAFDRSVRPQDDLFRFVNGSWLKNTPIPADKSNYGSFTRLQDEAEENLRKIIEEMGAKANKPAGSEEQKIGDLYASFMNEAKVEELGAKPVQPLLARIDALKSKDEIPALLAEFARMGIAPLGGLVNQDAKDSTRYTVYLHQFGMLGLPDRDFYLVDNERFTGIRTAYEAYVTGMLGRAGDAKAAEHARAVLALEKALAEKSWTRVEARDDDKTYNKFEIAKLNELTPGFDLAGYVRAAGVTAIDDVIVMQPSAYTGFAAQLKAQPLETWQAYLKMNVLTSYAPLLSKEYVDAQFDFYGKTLRGIQENEPRWKRAVNAVEAGLGDAVGRIYVERHFPPAAKARMETLVANLTRAYAQSIQGLEWMSPETKARAIDKLNKFTPKIGYPKNWKDYSALTVAADDLVGNIMRSTQVEYDRQLAKLGKPIDRDEWLMTPQTVNAYYNPGMNEIVFPAAILQPPFFDMNAEDAVNYGGIGAVIGHEIGHGFDDQGSKYDGDGNLRSWWTEEDRKRFEERTGALIAQYDGFCPFENECVQGAFTIGENIGDLGGLSIAYAAYKLSLDGKAAPTLDGFSGDQRFFIGWAQVWRRVYRDEELKNRLKTDPHSPSEYRCNGTVRNIPEFAAVFDVNEGDKMYLPPEQQVHIWR